MVPGPGGHGLIHHPSQNGLCHPGLASSTVLPLHFLVSTGLSVHQLRTPFGNDTCRSDTWVSEPCLLCPELPRDSSELALPGTVTNSCVCILETELAQVERKDPESADPLLYAKPVLDSLWTGTHQVHRTAPLYR